MAPRHSDARDGHAQRAKLPHVVVLSVRVIATPFAGRQLQFRTPAAFREAWVRSRTDL